MVFVTGASGMLGSRLVFDLVNQGKDVIALYRREEAPARFLHNLKYYTVDPDQIANRLTWVKGNILDRDSLMDVIQPDMEVYHCAAEVSFDPSQKNELLLNNIEGTSTLVNVCLEKKIKKLCHVSSIGALGSRIDRRPIDEETPWSADHKSPYSVSKYLSELEVWRGIAEGLNAVIVNPAVILGPGDWQSGSPEFFSRTANGMKFYTQGTTSYVDVRDVSKAMILLMDSEISEQKFVLASETLSYQSLFNRIADALNVERPKYFAPPILTATAWRAERLLTFFTRKAPRISRQTHRAAHCNDEYNGTKIEVTIPFKYCPMSETIPFVAKCYLMG